jgi:hypothetical protein
MRAHSLRFTSRMANNTRPTPLEEFALSKLVRVVGKEQATLLLDKAMASAQLEMVQTVQELLVLANVLIKNGGFPAVVGLSLKIFSILRGAVE